MAKVDTNSESFKILQENVSSARGKIISDADLTKELSSNKKLLEIYKEIEKTLKSSNQLYSKNRETVEFIYKLSNKHLLNQRLDKVTRQNINEINRSNLKYLEDSQNITRESLMNDLDSEKIKRKILDLNHKISQNEREKNNESDKYISKLSEFYEFVDRRGSEFGLDSDDMDNFVNEISRTNKEYVEALKLLASTDDAVKKTEYQDAINKIMTQQYRATGDFYDSIVVADDDKKGQKLKDKFINKLDNFLGDLTQSTAILSHLELSENVTKGHIDRLENEKERAEKLEKSTGKILRLFESLSYTPLNSIFNFRGARDKIKDAGGVGDSLSGTALKHVLEESALGKMGLVGAGALIGKEIISLMAKADDRVTKLARSFGVAKSEAGGLYDNMEGVNTELGRIGVNIDDLIDAQIKFNDDFAYSVNLTGQMLKDIVQSTKQIGLSQEATNQSIKYGLVNNREVGDVQSEILGTIIMQSDGLLNNKVALEKVLNVSGEVRANLKGNIGEIAKAVAKSQELGISLEKVNSIGEGLLDFESSINNELEAELLTSRELNLEKARYYALTGQTNELMGEINKNVGTFDDFVAMNVLQQQAFAKATGMSREEMSNMLFEQQVNQKIKSLGDQKFLEEERTILSQSEKFKTQYNKIMNNTALTQKEKMLELGTIARENISAMTAQQKFEETLNKVKEKVAQLFGDGAILDKLANGLIHFLGMFNIISENDVRQFDADELIRKTNPNLKVDDVKYKEKMSAYMGMDNYDFKRIKGIEDNQQDYLRGGGKSQYYIKELDKKRKEAYSEAMDGKNMKIFIDEITNAIKNIKIDNHMDSTRLNTALKKNQQH